MAISSSQACEKLSSGDAEQPIIIKHKQKGKMDVDAYQFETNCAGEKKTVMHESKTPELRHAFYSKLRYHLQNHG
ncbi:MAG: hypothetical protein R3240_09300 [Gammaproteobacteria bacterium]|nr:hypothetical protein [Gammaproteobacteria bacterium]